MEKEGEQGTVRKHPWVVCKHWARKRFGLHFWLI